VVGDGPHSWSAGGGQPHLAPTVGDAPRDGAWQTMIGSGGQPTAVARSPARPYRTGLRQRQESCRASRPTAVAGPPWSVARRLVLQLAGVTTAEERDLSREAGACRGTPRQVVSCAATVLFSRHSLQPRAVPPPPAFNIDRRQHGRGIEAMYRPVQSSPLDVHGRVGPQRVSKTETLKKNTMNESNMRT